MAKTNNDITQIEEELKVDKNTLLGKWRAKAYCWQNRIPK